MTALLQFKKLAAGYGQGAVLKDIDLAIAPGERLAVLGRNGMGKTSLIRAGLGILRPTAGQVFWRGQDVTALSVHARARLGIGLAPEGRQIFPNLSVRENLIATHRPRAGGWTLERVLQLFPRLAERLHHGGAKLSGGEQQMLAIGRALMTNPDLLILDEATEGLAPVVCEEIWRALADIGADGMALWIVDKNVAALARIAARFAVIEKGRIVWDGPSGDLIARPDVLQRYLGV